MSAKCQKRTFRHSLDHLVGAGDPLRMNLRLSAFGGLEVDHELKSDGTRQHMAGYIFSLICRERRWALMNRSAKRFDPPGTVAHKIVEWLESRKQRFGLVI
jgi:hypothetical protein